MENKLNNLLIKKVKGFNDFVVSADIFEKFLTNEFKIGYGNEKEINQVSNINKFRRDYIFVIKILDWGIGFSNDYTIKEALSHDSFIYYDYNKLSYEQLKNVINLYEHYLHQLTFKERLKNTIIRKFKTIYNKNKKITHDFDFIYCEYGFSYFIKNTKELNFYIKKMNFLNNENAPMYYSEIYNSLLKLKQLIKSNKNVIEIKTNIENIESEYENYRSLILND